MKGDSERRKERRTEFATKVEISRSDEGGWCKAIARDISAGGMFLQTDFECSLQNEMTVRFLLPGTTSHLEVRGQVARRDVSDSDDVSGMVGVGLKFLDTPPWVLDELRRFVEGGLKTNDCLGVPVMDDPE